VSVGRDRLIDRFERGGEIIHVLVSLCQLPAGVCYAPVVLNFARELVCLQIIRYRGVPFALGLVD